MVHGCAVVPEYSRFIRLSSIPVHICELTGICSPLRVAKHRSSTYRLFCQCSDPTLDCIQDYGVIAGRYCRQVILICGQFYVEWCIAIKVAHPTSKGPWVLRSDDCTARFVPFMHAQLRSTYGNLLNCLPVNVPRCLKI